MDVSKINELLLAGALDTPGLFPHLEALARASFVFRPDLGLDELPREPGVLLIRGPRQYGKSTWLEGQLRATIQESGAGSAFYLNGDEIRDADGLTAAIRQVAPVFRVDAPVRRLFIDEITSVSDWERGLKRLLDAGELRDVLVVTTGSKAIDLRRGAERLPGRKGRLARTHYLFPPIPYREFLRVCGAAVGSEALPAYVLSGGSPAAAAEIAGTGRLPEYRIETVRDWVLGECAVSGRDRGSLLAVYEAVLARGGTPIGQALLARETGLANNTVAAGYVELLADLMCVGKAHAFDAPRRVALRRRPAKFPPINLLAAVAFDRVRIRSVAEFVALPPQTQGKWLEWLVAQEIWRRSARRGDLAPEELLFWTGGGHEIDYVVHPDLFLEVKRGTASPFEYAWFARTFPKARLWIVGRDRFESDRLRGLTMEDLLLDETW